MKQGDIASYESGAFAIRIDNIDISENNGFDSDIAPAMVHEWMHYIQDISTISSFIGFYTWIRDMVRIMNVTCNSTGKTIHLPLEHDLYDESYGKYRALYNIFCGEKQEVRYDNPVISAEPIIEPNSIAIDGEARRFCKCSIEINETQHRFGLIALQEINAFYAQRIAEQNTGSTNYAGNTQELPTFPYYTGELLFDYYKVQMSDKLKFVFSYLCLDTIQSPMVFIETLKHLSGSTWNDKDVDKLESVIYGINERCSYPNNDAFFEITKDYEQWFGETGHVDLRKSLYWYLHQNHRIDKLKAKNGSAIIPLQIAEDINHIRVEFPIPIYVKEGELFGSGRSTTSAYEEGFLQNNFERAVVLWFHKRIYELLKTDKRDELNKYSECPMYKHCPYKKVIQKDYDCKNAPWTILEGENKFNCPYGLALHSLGLAQNKIEIDIERYI